MEFYSPAAATPGRDPISSASPSSSLSLVPSSSLTSTFGGFPTTQTIIGTTAPTASVVPSNGGGVATQGSSGPGQSIETGLSFLAFLCLVVAILYTVRKVRRDRQLRRLAQEGTGDNNLENGNNGGGHRSTNRAEEVDEAGCAPPQYRVYALDQPYVDPEMSVIYPDPIHYQVHLATHRTHARGQHDSMSSHRGLLSPSTSSLTQDYEEDVQGSEPARPPLNTTITTTTTTTTVTTFSSPPTSPVSRSIAAPNANVLTANPIGDTSASESETAAPVINAPSPAFTFASGRHLSILRAGLGGSNNIYQSSSNRHHRHSSSTVSSSPLPADTSLLNTNRQSSTPRSSQMSGSSLMMTEQNGGNNSSSSSIRSGVLHPGSLNRLRSQGPPPYVPLAPEEAAPQLPPEYDTTVGATTVGFA
ncbi:hypothetical protein BGZ83_003426 [Gryganskiella cystojenkinii]|nr:hypothetical protein BGZ83_003426 [Gryganskiella cystojenkinii]